MTRVELKKPSLCTSGPLTAETVREPLSVLQMIVASCYGPSGRLKQVHNGSGGYVITTSQSSVLLSSVRLSHPALDLLVASLRNHKSIFSDCGLFAAIFSCTLIDKCLNLPLSTHRVIMLNKCLLDICSSYLKSDDCACKLSVDFTSNKTLLGLARSVLCSKPACMLIMKEIDHVCVLLLQSFLFKVPDEGSADVALGRTLIVPIEGPSVMESTFVPGVLVEMPGCSYSRVVPPSGLPTTSIKLALFSISLSGEFSDTGEGIVHVTQEVDAEQVMLDQLMVLGKQLVDDHVHLLLCQKVIHPSLKQYLKEREVLVVDRLGAALMEPLSQMTGAQPVASLSSPPSTCYGSLKQISKVSHGDKQYLHLTPCDTSVCTLVLCNRSETSLKELVRTYQTAERTLHLLLKEPWLLLGGGCTEAHLAAYVRYKASNIPRSHLKELSCTAAEYKLVADCFCSALESVARSLEHDGGDTLTDLQDGHCWSIAPDGTSDLQGTEDVPRCGCQMLQGGSGLQWSILGSSCPPFSPRNRSEIFPQLMSNEPQVVDSFTAKYNGLRVAVETAGLILDLAYIIKDEN